VAQFDPVKLGKHWQIYEVGPDAMQIPEFWHGDEAHGSELHDSQFLPLQPLAHVQLYNMFSSFTEVHTPPFWHGLLAHAFAFFLNFGLNFKNYYQKIK
jgi:hypothetical protein